MDADGRRARVGLPAFSLSRLSSLQLDAEEAHPEAAGALRIVCGELNERQRRVWHRPHDTPRFWIDAIACNRRTEVLRLSADTPGRPVTSRRGSAGAGAPSRKQRQRPRVARRNNAFLVKRRPFRDGGKSA